MNAPATTESRSARIAIALASLAALFVLLLPPTYSTPDEAKYIGLGLNILEGHGLVTDFGVLFILHSPLWPLVLALPRFLFGIDALAVGHVVNALSASLLVAMTGAIVWRVRPVAGALAAIALAGVTFLHALSRTAGLDLPAAACSVAFLWLALRALDRGSVRAAFVAGLVLGVGFLFKETALPYLPVPFFVALLGGVGLATVLRLGAATLGAFTLTTAWWFALHAALSGKVYRLGTPAWTLVPIVLAIGLVLLLGWRAERLGASARLRTAVARLPAAARRHWPAALAWGSLAAWTLGQLAVYARTSKLAGADLVRPGMYISEAKQYGPTLGDALAFGIIGGLFALTLVRRSQAVRELVFAFVAGIPLVLLVMSIGENPRHYVATIAVLVGLGAAGWVRAAAAAASDRRWAAALAVGILVAVRIATFGQPLHAIGAILAAAAATALLAGGAWALARRRGGIELTAGTGAPATGRTGARPRVALLLAIAFVAVAIPSATWAATRTRDYFDARSTAVRTVGAWVDANVPRGAMVAVGPALAYELAVEIRDGNRIVRISPDVTVGDAKAPYGLSWANGTPVTDPLTVGALPNIDQLDVFGASGLRSRLETFRPAIWLQAAYLPKGVDTTPTYALLDATTGVTAVQRWDFPYRKEHIVVVAYRIDVDAVAFDPGRVFIGPALGNLFHILQDKRATDGAAALVDRIVLTPDTPEAREVLDRIRALGATPAP